MWLEAGAPGLVQCPATPDPWLPSRQLCHLIEPWGGMKSREEAALHILFISMRMVV